MDDTLVVEVTDLALGKILLEVMLKHSSVKVNGVNYLPTDEFRTITKDPFLIFSLTFKRVP